MNKSRIYLIYWVPVILWTFLFFTASSMSYDSQVLRPAISENFNLEQVEQTLSQVEINYASNVVSVYQNGAADFIEFILRKSANVFVYFVFGILIF